MPGRATMTPTTRASAIVAWLVGAGCGGICLVMTLRALDGDSTPASLIIIAIVLALAAVLLTVWAAGVMGRFERADDLATRAAEVEDGFRAVLEVLPEPILLVTSGEADDLTDRRITFANAAARYLLRTQAGGLLVQAVRDPKVLGAIDEALFGRVERTVDFQGGDAQERQWRVWTSPLPPAPDGLARVVARLVDETDGHRMMRMRSDFLANASHELRTPLASLSGFIETLKGPARGDEAARDRFLDIMQAQTDRMGRLVNDLLSLSRIELNEHVPPSGTTDLSLACTDVLDALAPLAEARGVRFETELVPRGGALIAGARDEAIQVIQNLAANALNYTPDGGVVRITVEAGGDVNAVSARRLLGAPRFWLLTPSARGTLAVVTVQDQGPGIPRDRLPRLTERFYRVEGQKSGARPGTGLGLAIVKHTLIRHGGGLAVESVPGTGSAFVACFGLVETTREREPGRHNKTVTPAS